MMGSSNPKERGKGRGGAIMRNGQEINEDMGRQARQEYKKINMRIGRSRDGETVKGMDGEAEGKHGCLQFSLFFCRFS